MVHDQHMATLFLIVGLPGAGKTTRAKELAATRQALRLTPDEWMIPLFAEPLAGDKRDGSVKADGRVVYLEVDRDEQFRRIAGRLATAPEQTFPVTAADLDLWREEFEAPDPDELADGDIPGPPPGWPDWPQWAASRWPSLTYD